MNGPLHSELGRRESQIMDVVYRLEEASVEEIRTNLPDPPSNSSVRSMLRLLEEKGYLDHYQEGRRYFYYPTHPKGEVRRSMLRHLTKTFFGGAVSEAVAALLSVEEENLSSEDLDEMERLINRAQSKSKEEEGGDERE